MNTILFLIMRRMRVPLLVLLIVYAVAIVGITLIPGMDDQGNLWYMDFFHAYYFVSYMGTTIGFGEIPYPFSEAQRMWVILSLYMTVIAWIYAIGALLSLIQDDALRSMMIENRFARMVKNIHEPFYLICGYGDTGSALVSSLEERFMRSVVIEIKQERINILMMENYPVYVPKLCADASKPLILVNGGLKNPDCAGVIAITDDNLANLHIAITAKLLNPDITVIGRVDSRDVADNMDSFGTDFIIDPFDIFSRKLHTALHAPNLLLLRECLTTQKETCEPLEPPERGLWVLCGYGRFGKAVYEQFKGDKNIRFVVIEANPERTGYPRVECIKGWGTEADTLRQAHIEEAVGIIAGTNDDVNNLSIIMTARELNPNLFVVIRQNKAENQIIFEAAKADIVMQPSQIIASHIRVLLTTPLLVDFIILAKQFKYDWTEKLIKYLRKILNSTKPDIWQMTINQETCPAVWDALSNNQPVNLKCLRTDPRNRKEYLACIPLLLVRAEENILLPEDSECLDKNAQILWCGKRGVMSWMERILHDPLVLTYILTGEIVSRSYVWRWLQNLRIR
ncbi:MAG: NAD-binding protein [Thiomargarita sp.]|nr:NAD-binding protein [Thiomargarita sp.]